MFHCTNAEPQLRLPLFCRQSFAAWHAADQRGTVGSSDTYSYPKDTIRISRVQAKDTDCGVAGSDTSRIIKRMPEALWITVAKRRMRELDLRQDDLCAALGVKTRGAVGHYLTGRRQPTPDQLIALAKKCGIRVGELLTDDASETGAAEYRLDPDVLEEIFSYLETYRRRLGDAPIGPDEMASLTATLYPEYKADKESDLRGRTERHQAHFETVIKDHESRDTREYVSTTSKGRNSP